MNTRSWGEDHMTFRYLLELLILVYVCIDIQAHTHTHTHIIIYIIIVMIGSVLQIVLPISDIRFSFNTQ